MNEVTRIHLGRQPFVIAVDAQKALRAYLDQIKEAVGSKSDAAKEIELRMAELLTERGISGEKVVLPEDVQFLKDQLGEPTDFKDDDGEPHRDEPSDGQPARRLFRDTKNGLVAGVCAGLASYTGVDVVLVRIIFLIAVVTGGWGLLIYIVFWLLTPEAKTPSERLQMQGKAVTVDTLKEAVERADVPGTVRRAGNAVASILNVTFRLLLAGFGLALILTALAAIFTLLAGGIYMALHHGQLVQENFFPVGRAEHLITYIGLAWLALTPVFILFVGMAIFRRKWPVAPWITGVLLSLIFVGMAAGSAVVGDMIPKVRQRYEAAHHTTTRMVQPFAGIDLQGKDVLDRVDQGGSYKVTFSYIGHPDLSKIRTTVVDHQLHIDTTGLHDQDCSMLCLFPYYDLRVVVTSPLPVAPPGTIPLEPEKPYLP